MRARRTAAGLAVVAATLPLTVLAAPPAWAGSPSALTEPGECDPAVRKLITATPPALLQLGAQAANTVATGRGVKVAVVDSGVDANNPHLTGGVVEPGVDLSGARTPNGLTDVSGHGTAVAGEIAARRITGSGVVGLAPDATIVPIRVYTKAAEDIQEGEQGVTQFAPTAAGIANGINAAARSGAKIINVSMSTPDDTADLRGAVQYATSKGALVVASAGNRNQSDDKTNTPRYPGAYPEALAVAAIDNTGSVTEDSIHGSYVDVAAPGLDVLTTYFGVGDCQLANDYASTSYATAYVSATAALIAQAHPTETPAQWRYRLEVTAQRVRPDTRDDFAGWGNIQPYEALTFVSDGSATGPQDPAASATSTAPAVVPSIAPVAVAAPDHTARDQTLWLTLGGVVAVLVLALVALLRRDGRRRDRGKVRPPAGVR